MKTDYVITEHKSIMTNDNFASISRDGKIIFVFDTKEEAKEHLENTMKRANAELQRGD